MTEGDEFERATTAMRDKVLLACEPDGSSLDGPDHFAAMGAALWDLTRVNITFWIEHGEHQFAREVIEAIERDLLDIRRENGWLND